MRINKLFFVIALLVVFSCGSKDEEVLIGDWAKIGDFDGPPRNGATSFVIGETVYLGFGYNSKDKVGRNDLWYWNGAGGWTPIEFENDLVPEGRYNATSFVINGKAYVGLGKTASNTVMNDFWEYNPTTKKWRQVASLPAVARHSAAGIAYNNKGYVVGGDDLNNILKEVLEFTPPNTDNELGSWSKASSYDGSKRYAASMFVINDRMYLFGGRTGNSLATDFHYFDKSGKWTKLREIRNANPNESFDDDYGNLARQYASVFIIDKKVYVSLGDVGSGSSNNTTYEYHPDSDLWFKKTRFEGTPRTEAVGFTLGNRGFVGTGISGGSDRKDDIWEFFPWRDEDATNNY